ncbi:MAG TPA: phosphate ABC transporter substrate-binding protein PstS [Polyangiaceae bacterium]
MAERLRSWTTRGHAPAPGRRAFLLLLAGGVACSRSKSDISLNGVGATFPYPLYSKWIAEYHRLRPEVRINYQSIGSGGGVRQIVAGTVDFGATDVPMLEDEARGAPGTLLHIPMAVGSVVVCYRLEGVRVVLRLTPELLASIFLGEITRWNAPELKAHNPGIVLPDLPIVVVCRSDGSGTTAIFTELLAQSSPAWRERVGAGKLVRWPAGIGAKGNEGVAGQLQSTPGAIGYTELAYATQNRLSRVAIRNAAGAFVLPAPNAATAAAETVPMPDALHVSLASAPSAEAYPLAAYTYLLVYRDARDAEKGQALAEFLWWALHEGQRFVIDLDYAPLPKNVVARAEAVLRTLRAGGKAILAER